MGVVGKSPKVLLLVLKMTRSFQEGDKQLPHNSLKHSHRSFHKSETKEELVPIPKHTSTCLLNPLQGGDSTTALGCLCQCLTTLSMKNFS